MNAAEPGPVAVTGVGVVNAAGGSAKHYWETVLLGSAAPTPVHLFGAAEPPQHVFRVDDDLVDHGFALRHVKRVDRVTLLASAAVREAVADAGLALGPGAGDRVGLLTGNCTAGWSYVEPQLQPLYRDGNLSAVNSFVATAWFPTAAQGEVSIALGMGGFSKTFCAESLSSAFALRQAGWALRDGTLDAVVVCGVEAPLTPLVHNACVATGLVSTSAGYRPFDERADGAFLGEGAAAVVLELPERAAARRATARAELSALCVGAPDTVVAATRSALGGRRPGYVAVEARADVTADAEERAFVDALTAGAGPTDVVAHTATSGVLLGAAFLTGVVTAVLALREGAVPGGTRVHLGAAGVDVDHAAAAVPADLHEVVVTGSDGDGQRAAAVLTGIPALP